MALANQGKRWTRVDDALFEEKVVAGVPLKQIAVNLKRSENAVRARLKQLYYTLFAKGRTISDLKAFTGLEAEKMRRHVLQKRKKIWDKNLKEKTIFFGDLYKSSIDSIFFLELLREQVKDQNRQTQKVFRQLRLCLAFLIFCVLGGILFLWSSA